jgi:AcrR family transcriptional regulator
MQQRSEETRGRILEAALNHFSASGYNAASVDEICAEAGVSKGAFYHHFPTKQAVFLALLEDWLETIDSGMESLRQESVPQTLLQLTNLLPVIFAEADNHLPMFLEYWIQASRDETIWQATISPYRRYQDLFARLIEKGVAEGTLKPVDPQAAAQVILSLAVGLFLQGVLDPQGADWQKVARESLQIVMNGLAK